MVSISIFNKYFYAFYLIGLTFNPYDDFKKNQSKYCHFIKTFMPPLIQLAVTTASWLFVSVDTREVTITGILVADSMSFCFISLNCVSAFTTLFLIKSMKNVYRLIADLIECIEYLFQLKVKFKTFQKNYNRKMYLLLAQSIHGSIMRFIITSNIWSSHTDYAINILIFYRVFVVLLLLIHIEIILLIYTVFNAKLNSFECEMRVFSIIPRKLNLIRIFRHSKFVHFKLWEICDAFNRCYGWYCPILFSGNAIHVTVTAFHAYINCGIAAPMDFNQLMRKIFLLLVYCE